MTDEERIKFFLESLRDVFAKAAKESKIISEQLKDKREQVSDKLGGINNALVQDKCVQVDKAFTEAHKGESSEQLLAQMRGEEPVSEDLEKTAKHYLYSNILYDDVYVGEPTDKDCIEMFKAGAKWQKKQLIKEAINGIARPDDDEVWCDLKSFNLKDGDKIKIIIIEED